MSYDLRRIGEDRDDGDEVQYEYCSSSSEFSDAESCSSGSDGEGDQDQFSGCRNSDASVYDLSSLMAQLPNSNRRGLSQYYEGKSQSFTSLSDVKCLEDLPKRENPMINPYIKRKIKPCKSYADGLCESRDFVARQRQQQQQQQQASSRGSCGNLIMARNGNGNGRELLCSSRPPAIPLNKNSRRLN